MKFEIEMKQVVGKGWVVHAPTLRATAQGETVEEALGNLGSLIDRYPEVLVNGQ